MGSSRYSTPSADEQISKWFGKPKEEPAEPVTAFYAHYKGGVYVLLARDITNADNHPGEEMVLYMNLEGRRFVRTASDFFGHVGGERRFRPVHVWPKLVVTEGADV